jgi:hypothetical protein
MPVTVDDLPLRAESLGFTTVGQVLSHLRKENRLVVHVLIDGSEPDLSRLNVLKNSPLQGHTIYIETADPRRLVSDALRLVQTELDDADRIRRETVDLLQSNQQVKALEKLGGCVHIWQHAEQAVISAVQLLRINLARVHAEGKPLPEIFAGFTAQLKSIKSALESRDFVALTDTLAYEATETSRLWRSVIESIQAAVQ